MCVDVSKETLDSLIALILEHRSVLLQGPGASRKESSAANVAEAVDLEISASGGLCSSVEQRDLDAVVVLSAVNMLTNQMFQLLRGSTPAAVRVLTSVRITTGGNSNQNRILCVRIRGDV